MIWQVIENAENKPRLGQGRAGIRHRKPQLTEHLTTTLNKSHKIPKIPMIQNNRIDFPVQEQSISSKREGITQGMIQDKNREIPFYPDAIYRTPPQPPEIYDFEENCPYHGGIKYEAYQRPDKSYFKN